MPCAAPCHPSGSTPGRGAASVRQRTSHRSDGACRPGTRVPGRRRVTGRGRPDGLRPDGRADALGLNERLLELLADAGLARKAAARASYLLIVYVFGSIELEGTGVALSSFAYMTCGNSEQWGTQFRLSGSSGAETVDLIRP
jgi:hypothetical protein